MNKKVLVILFIVLAVVILVVLEFVVFKIVSKKSTIAVDANSQTRMQQLNNVMRSRFGNNWPFVLIMMLVFLLIIFALLYFVFKRTTININVDEKTGKILSRTNLIVIGIVSVGLIGAGIYAVIKEQRDHNNTVEENGDFQDKSKAQQFLELVGLVLVLIVVIIFVVYGIHKYRMHRKEMKEGRGE